jgi:hypothetical protein
VLPTSRMASAYTYSNYAFGRTRRQLAQVSVRGSQGCPHWGSYLKQAGNRCVLHQRGTLKKRCALCLVITIGRSNRCKSFFLTFHRLVFCSNCLTLDLDYELFFPSHISMKKTAMTLSVVFPVYTLKIHGN